jgi:hypothetical protein
MLSRACQIRRYNGAWGTYRVGWLVSNTQKNRGVERLLPLKLLEGQEYLTQLITRYAQELDTNRCFDEKRATDVKHLPECYTLV